MSDPRVDGRPDSLSALIRSYLDDPEVALTPGDPKEHLRNRRTYGFVPADVDATAVSQALGDVADALRARFDDSSSPATFYAWADELAGQLRCSLSSVSEDELPFRGAYQPTNDPAPVITHLQGLKHPGLVLWEELSDTDASDLDRPETAVPPFPVWTARIA